VTRSLASPASPVAGDAGLAAARLPVIDHDVRLAWFPPGTCLTRQGEPAAAPYQILPGTPDALSSIPAAS
jgi:hypothetical protein